MTPRQPEFEPDFEKTYKETTSRPNRGSSWMEARRLACVSDTDRNWPSELNPDIGFRLVREEG